MTPGRFTGQRFTLAEQIIPKGAASVEALRSLSRAGIRFVVAALDAPSLRALAQAPEAQDMLILNAGAPDDELRAEDCRRNLLHTIPDRAMLTDGLAQYLILKRWKRW